VLGLVTLVIAGVAARSVIALSRHQFFPPAPPPPAPEPQAAANTRDSLGSVKSASPDHLCVGQDRPPTTQTD
jgi:hypothetical protein